MQSMQPTESQVSCYTLSRLKGIETQCSLAHPIADRRSCYTLSRLKGIETHLTMRRLPDANPRLLHTFPFEGN